jgi:hypothetical protein
VTILDDEDLEDATGEAGEIRVREPHGRQLAAALYPSN